MNVVNRDLHMPGYLKSVYLLIIVAKPFTILWLLQKNKGSKHCCVFTVVKGKAF